MPRPDCLQMKYFDTFVLLCCWQLWKRRNGAVLRNETLTMAQFLQT
ncbi:hypothetical protein HU200_025217 [Digitaria exilis]|uniref:Uncharacterized protein n=1 Tax=Digitaria exilis TaxID=1010633 RepID=A0A835C1A7_9POAL|nr:hypothetical protein HU200_025217 [Digitaria exilis]